jgi:hypothetical protein
MKAEKTTRNALCVHDGGQVFSMHEPAIHDMQEYMKD